MSEKHGHKKELTPEDEEEERKSFQQVISTFKTYR